MERVIATHHLEGHRLDVVESIDDDSVTVRLVVDGELLPPDVQPDQEPSAEKVASLFRAWQRQRATAAPAQVANAGGLAAREVIALLDALDDEQRAEAIYDQVLADFGPVLPFAHVVDAERRHIEALTELMHRHKVPVPSNPWRGKVPRFASVDAACAAAVQAEIDNGALYDRLIAATDRPDILEVFRALREASLERHLPAFRRCAARRGPGHGWDHERGRHGHRGGT